MKKLTVIFLLILFSIYPNAVFSENWIQVNQFGHKLDTDSVKVSLYYVEYIVLMGKWDNYLVSECKKGRMKRIKSVTHDNQNQVGYPETSDWFPAEQGPAYMEMNAYVCSHYFHR